ncbi:hypothetical protein JCGZ_15394 [Jatropha curcas]|uniref:Uncharacterized protein n=1 Tax=Jatropha curcas TaxID=180498 RepID=A0A067KGY5_JATCU|nr:hypothetical protein JCGZ_15394 [Jatropha curcas]
MWHKPQPSGTRHWRANSSRKCCFVAFQFSDSTSNAIINYKAQLASDGQSIVAELALYLDAAGGQKKRRVYNIDSQTSQFYCGSISNVAGAPTSRPQPENSAEEISALRACVDDQKRQLAELKAHVMQMFGPQTNATSFDPPTIIDPPTPATTGPKMTSFIPPPLDIVADTIDTLVTPPDTGANLKDTTLDPTATSLVKHHRFDCNRFATSCEYSNFEAQRACFPELQTVRSDRRPFGKVHQKYANMVLETSGKLRGSQD